jgi:hypothetical protein
LVISVFLLFDLFLISLDMAPEHSFSTIIPCPQPHPTSVLALSVLATVVSFFLSFSFLKVLWLV